MSNLAFARRSAILGLSLLLAATALSGCRIETYNAPAPRNPRHPAAPRQTVPASTRGATQPRPNPAPPSSATGGVGLHAGLARRVAQNGQAQPGAPHGRLYVQVNNGLCDVGVDDQSYGRTSSLDVILPAVQHRVSCTVDNGASEVQLITVRESNQPTRASFDAAKISASGPAPR